MGIQRVRGKALAGGNDGYHTHTQTHIHHTVEPEAGGLNSGPLATWPQARKRLTHHRAQPSSPNPPH